MGAAGAASAAAVAGACAAILTRRRALPACAGASGAQARAAHTPASSCAGRCCCTRVVGGGTGATAPPPPRWLPCWQTHCDVMPDPDRPPRALMVGALLDGHYARWCWVILILPSHDSSGLGSAPRCAARTAHTELQDAYSAVRRSAGAMGGRSGDAAAAKRARGMLAPRWRQCGAASGLPLADAACLLLPPRHAAHNTPPSPLHAAPPLFFSAATSPCPSRRRAAAACSRFVPSTRGGCPAPAQHARRHHHSITSSLPSFMS